jgi:hypothetical protein
VGQVIHPCGVMYVVARLLRLIEYCFSGLKGKDGGVAVMNVGCAGSLFGNL